MINIQYKVRTEIEDYAPKVFRNAPNLLVWCFYEKMPDQITLTSINEKEKANYEYAIKEILNFCESKKIKKPKITFINIF
jgi:hypothetical protein